MKTIALLFTFSALGVAQSIPTINVTSDPSGSCNNERMELNTTNGKLWVCSGGTWAQGGGGGGTPGGANTQVQFNDSGSFGGNSGLTFNKSTGNVTIGTTVLPASLAPATLTDGATVSWSVGGFTVSNATLTLNHTTATRALNISSLNSSAGWYTIKLVQDSTGGAALTLGTGCAWKVGGGGGGAINLSTAANAVDILAIYYDGTACYANFQTNFN